MLILQFLIKMKIAFVILYSLVAINLMTLKTSTNSTEQLHAPCRQQGLIRFLFE